MLYLRENCGLTLQAKTSNDLWHTLPDEATLTITSFAISSRQVGRASLRVCYGRRAQNDIAAGTRLSSA
jgi:hypothetical protein